MAIKKFKKFSIVENTKTDNYIKDEYYWVLILSNNEWIPARYDGDSSWVIVGSDEIYYDENSTEFEKVKDGQVEVGSKIEKPNSKVKTIRTDRYPFL
jgi:hypothetical protein